VSFLNVAASRKSYSLDLPDVSHGPLHRQVDMYYKTPNLKN